MSLFMSPWARAAKDAEQAAIREVDELDRGTLLDPDLAGIIDKLAHHFSLDVAKLQPESKRRMRRKALDQAEGPAPTNPFGATVMDYKVPFTGDPISFQLAPANCIAPALACEVRSDHLFISVADDDEADKKVEEFADQVSRVLEALRAEVDSWFSQLRAALESVANDKIKQIAAERADDGPLDVSND